MRQLRVEQPSSLRQEIDTRRSRVVPGKHVMSDLIIQIKEAEALPLKLHKVNTETQQLKDNNETPTVMVYVVQINKTTTLPLPTE